LELEFKMSNIVVAEGVSRDGVLAAETMGQPNIVQALGLEQDGGFNPDIATRLTELSNLYYLQGNLDGFKQSFRESVSQKNYLTPYIKTYVLMTILGSLYIHKPDRSARLLSAIDKSAAILDYPPNPVEKRYCARAEAHARKALGDQTFKVAYAMGQKMTLDEALDFALKTVEEM
jgi:hypothetical protein